VVELAKQDNPNHQKTGKGLSDVAQLATPTILSERIRVVEGHYSQVYQSTTRNLSRAFINFFEKCAGFSSDSNYGS